MKTIQLELFTFDELNENAKSKAIEDHRSIIDIDLENGINYLANGALTGTGFKIDEISYSGFYSQGDGASFSGFYDSSLIDLDKLRGFSLRAYELMTRIDSVWGASGLTSENHISANVKRVNYRYSHENTVSIQDIEINDISYDCDADEKLITAFEAIENYLTELKNSLCDLIYRSLESEYEYQNSDKYISEILIINDYYFLENGEIYYEKH